MDKIKNLLAQKPRVINLGLRSFEESLKHQGVPVIHIQWRPPAGGKKRLLKILEKVR